MKYPNIKTIIERLNLVWNQQKVVFYMFEISLRYKGAFCVKYLWDLELTDKTKKQWIQSADFDNECSFYSKMYVWLSAGKN